MPHAELENRSAEAWLRREQQLHAHVIEMRVAFIESRHAESHYASEQAHLKFVRAIKALRDMGFGKGHAG